MRARRREGVGRVSSDEADEVDGEDDELVVVVLVAKESNAARIEASVEALMRCCLAREEGGWALGMGKREEEEGGGAGGARARRFGGCDDGGFGLFFYSILRKGEM